MINLGNAIGLGLILIIFTGCANKPTIADSMRDHAKASQTRANLKGDLARDWENGFQRVETGEKSIKNGEKRIKLGKQLIEKGEKDIARGNQQIGEGTKAMQESEHLFREAFPDQTLIVPK